VLVSVKGEFTVSSSDVLEAVASQNFLAFFLNDKNYAFPILKVNEVIVLPEITPMPKTPKYMKGIMNLRNQIIPIIDLRLALCMEEVEYDQQTCVIIVKMLIDENEKMVGFIVDCVSEVFEIPVSSIEKPPSYGENLEDNFLKGIGKVKDKIIMLLDIDKVLSKKDADDFMFCDIDDYES